MVQTSTIQYNYRKVVIEVTATCGRPTSHQSFWALIAKTILQI